MTQYRKDKLENGEIYHIYTRSIAKFVVFNNDDEYSRMYDLLDLYRYKDFIYRYSKFIELSVATQNMITDSLNLENELLVEIVAFCLMPTHIHLILKQVADNGISNYMSKILNGYSRFFNVKHKRTGPLWSGRFKSVLVYADEQLIHLTRYIHLNPTSAGMIRKPEEWDYSSYREYLKQNEKLTPICNYENLISITSKQYQKFVEDQKDHQKQLSVIKSLTIDNYSG